MSNADETMKMWEILVPTVRNPDKDGNVKPFRTRYHRVWDEKVREITGGMTVMPPAKGQWVNEGKLYAERMIPVRIMATTEQMNKIVKMTAKYYDQLAVLAYCISNEVLYFDATAK